MRYLVTDPAGMVGNVMCLVLTEMGHEVFGYGGDPLPSIEHLGIDLHDERHLRDVLSKGDYNAVINCSAVVNQFAEEDRAEAVYINSYLPHLLESQTAGTSTIVVNRSTDCVFSGAKGDYTVKDVPDATSYYARTKVIGELYNSKDLNIRVSLIGPERLPGIGLLDWFLRQHGVVHGYEKAIWTGVTTIEYARIVEELVKVRAHGLIHCAPEESISKYDLLRYFEEFFPSDDRTVVRFNNDLVDKSLVPEWAGQSISVPSYRGMVADMSNWITIHHALYPDYYSVRS